jgi:hypothetical protein
MPDGHVADQWVEVGLSEDLGDQAHVGMDDNALAVGGGYPGTLLSSVLQGEKAEESQTASLSLGGKDPYHPAFFVGVIKWDAAKGKIQLASHSVILCNPICSGQQQKSQFKTLSIG